MENKDGFQFTYSAIEQEEIKAIKDKYSQPKQEEDKMTKLRRLDASVTRKATVASLVLGIIGTLILGTGMSFAMTDIGKVIGLKGDISMIMGIIVGIIGIVILSVAYPVYNNIVEKQRKKIAPEIIRISDELLK